MKEVTAKVPDNNARKATPTQFQEEATPATLGKILDKLDKIERTVNKFGNITDQTPEAMVIATNFIDDAAEQMQKNGQNLEERAAQVLQLLDRLTQPVTMQRLITLLDMADQLPQIIGDITNMADTMMSKAAENGVDVKERMVKLQSVINRATSPNVLDKAHAVLDATEQADDMISFAVDQLDELVVTLQNHGLDPKEMSEDGIKFLSAMVAAHHKAMQKPPRKIGLVGMLRALADPDFQKFLGFITALGKNFGKRL